MQLEIASRRCDDICLGIKGNLRATVMPSDDAKRGSSLDRNSHPALDRLANALGCTAGDFYDKSPTELAQLAEVIHLWRRLACDDDRERVLSLLRKRSTAR
jgi:hypothetical protein